jgi:hypothetical protein
MSGIIDAPRKEDMPDLLRLDSVVDINGGPRAVTTQIRTPSPSGPISESANEDQLMQSKMSNRDPNVTYNLYCSPYYRNFNVWNLVTAQWTCGS